MSERMPWMCIDRVVPPEYAQIAWEKAVQERSDNGTPFEAAALQSRLWQPGQTLRVHFLDGLPDVQSKVVQYARQWCKYASLSLDFGGDQSAEIRVSFEGDGSWSALGTDALVQQYYPKDTPTMNLGWLTPDSAEEEYSRVVLHEFGHALGLIHEHQSPAGGMRWNKTAVIADLSGPPNYWDVQTIEHNVFLRYSGIHTQFTEFDPQSIMLYAFPRHWTLDGVEFPQNTRLSATDKGFIKLCYP